MAEEKKEKQAPAEGQEQKTFDGGVTEADITGWKNRHRKVVRIDVVDGDEMHVGYFKHPTIEVMQAVAKMSKTDEVKGATVLFDGCWLGGSRALREDGVLFVTASGQLGEAFKQCIGSLKNL